jgi:nitrilase
LIDLIVVSAAFTYQTGKDHWELLLRTRAIENQCFLLASAQGGKHECGRETWGHSMLISPWGDIMCQSTSGSGIVIGDVDQKITNDVRNKLPAIFHQRYDL